MKAYIFLGLITASALVVGVQRSVGADNMSTQEKALKNPVPNVCGVKIEAAKWVEVNESDDDIDEDWDKNVEPVPGEKNTLKITVTGTADKSEATIVVKILPDPNQKTEGFWPGTRTVYGQPPVGNETDGKEKRGAKNNPYTFTVPPGKSVAQTLYIEGLKNSSNKSDVAKIQATASALGGVTSDKHPFPASNPPPVDHELLVYKVDIDIDSNNGQKLNSPARDEAEDKIEASEKVQSTGHKRPGKYVFVNGGFNKDNNDACPGWADGFDINPGSTCDNVAAVFGFTPVILELPEPFDPTKAEIQFDYEASDPAAVTFAAGGGTPTDPFTYTLGPGGKLRLWKKNGPESRNKAAVTSGGDFVPRAKFLWSKLGSGRQITLYLEAVRPSASLANILNIGVTATEGDVICSDDIHVTSVYLASPVLLIDTPGSGYHKIPNPDPKYPGTSDFRDTGMCAVEYTSSANWIPAGVDPTLYPMNEMYVSMMQNLLTTSRVLAKYQNPVGYNWDASLPQGTIRLTPAIYHITMVPPSPQQRTNDCLPTCSPVYTPSTNWAQPGGALSKTNDNPHHIAKDRYAQEGDGVWFAYTNTLMSLNDHFCSWTCGIDSATRQIYPLCERKWSITASSDAPGTKPIPDPSQTAPTMVPVRVPFANATYGNPLYTSSFPDPNAGSVQIVKP